MLNFLVFSILFPYLYIMVSKTDIIARLQREILPLQGYKPLLQPAVDRGLELLGQAFPGGMFPRGAMHDMGCPTVEDKVAAGGFIAGILSVLAKNNGNVVWISNGHHVFPPALAGFGLKPEHVVFVELAKERERAWAIEEALKCNGVSAVVGETDSISFTASRRYQLAVERSGVTGFLLCGKQVQNTTSIARWVVKHRKSETSDLPGIGFPSWQVELLKARNGRPMTWELEWRDGHFNAISEREAIPILHRKTG